MSIFVPTFAMGLLALIFLFKLYKRSISTTISIVTFAIASNLHFYGYINSCGEVLLAGMALLVIRGMLKPDDDKVIITSWKKDVSCHRTH